MLLNVLNFGAAEDRIKIMMQAGNAPPLSRTRHFAWYHTDM